MSQQDISPGVVQAPASPPAWRTEPEIDSTRQQFLSQCLEIAPDIGRGIYPFRGIALTRADIEWLLLAHEQGRGPVEWSDESQRAREGLDLRAANLEQVNLRGLPLARLRGGLTKEEWVATTVDQRTLAGIHLERANLGTAHLEGAILRGAFLQGAVLHMAHLEEAVLFHTHLEGAYLRKAHLAGANMRSAHLEGAYMRDASMPGVDLRHATCDATTDLDKVMLFEKQRGCAQLADVRWGDCNLAVINWLRVTQLGDEAYAVSRTSERASTAKERQEHIERYQEAVRGYRQLANTMRAQGMNEEAVPFAYRAQVVQREVLWRQLLWDQPPEDQSEGWSGTIGHLWHSLTRKTRNLASYSFSWFLDILAGYGYKPRRSLGLYLLMILGFAICYLVLGHLSPGEALVFSITAFHGRGFSTGPFMLSSPVIAIAAVEAIVGLFIEISFIATFTQRFFGR